MLADSAPQPNVLLAKIRAIMFFAWSFLLSLPLFVTMMVMAPLVLAFDKYRCVLKWLLHRGMPWPWRQGSRSISSRG